MDQQQQQLGEKLFFRKIGLYNMNAEFSDLFSLSSSSDENDSGPNSYYKDTHVLMSSATASSLPRFDASRFSFSKQGGNFTYLSMKPETINYQSMFSDNGYSIDANDSSRRVDGAKFKRINHFHHHENELELQFIVFVFTQTGILRGIIGSSIFVKDDADVVTKNNNNFHESDSGSDNGLKLKEKRKINGEVTGYQNDKKRLLVDICQGGIGWIGIGNEVEERLVIVLADGRVFLHDGIWRDGSKKLKNENFTVYNMFDEQGDYNIRNKRNSFMEISMVHITHSGIILLTRTAYLMVGKFIQDNDNNNRDETDGSGKLRLVVEKWNNGRSIVADPFSQQILSVTVEDDIKNKEIRQVFCSTSDGGIVSINEDERAAEKNIVYHLTRTAKQDSLQVDNNDDSFDSATVTLMSMQPSNRFIACFTDTNFVIVIDCALNRKVIEFYSSSKSLPRQLTWCGDDSVLLSFKDLGLLMIGPYGDWVRYAYSTPIVLANEIDGCHVFTSFQHEYLQRVPDYYNAIFRIGSFEPSAMLYDATEALIQGDPTADENVRGLRQDNTLRVAIVDCIQAALFEFDVRKQQSLLKAATLGKSFLLKEQERKSLSDAFVTACNTLRVLNTVRHEQVGLPITYVQYNAAGGSSYLIKRLLSRNMHYLALKICEYLGLEEIKQDVLLDWVCKYVRYGRNRNQMLEINTLHNHFYDGSETIGSNPSNSPSLESATSKSPSLSSSSQGYASSQVLPSIVPRVVRGEMKAINISSSSSAAAATAASYSQNRSNLRSRDSDASVSSRERSLSDSELSEDEIIYRDIMDRLRSYPDIPYAAIATEAEKASRYELSVLLLSHEPINTTHIKALIRMNFIDVALQRALSVMDADLIQMTVLAGVNRFGEVNMKKKGSSNNSNNQELDDRGIRTFDADKDEKFHAFFQTVRAYPYIVDLIVDIAKQRGNLKLMHYIYNLYHMKANASDLDILILLEEEDVDSKISQLEAARDELMREIVDIDKHDPISYGAAETSIRSVNSQIHQKKILNFGRTAFDSSLNNSSQEEKNQRSYTVRSSMIMSALGTSRISLSQHDQLQEIRHGLRVRTEFLADEIMLLNHQKTLEKSERLARNDVRLVGLPLVKTLELLVRNKMIKEAEILSKDMKMPYQRWNTYKNKFLAAIS